MVWDYQQVDRAKPWVVLVCLYPLLRWIFLGFTDGLSANPAEFLTRSSGTWTLVGLLVVLLITPLKTMFKFPALVRLRRLIGLMTFFYAFLHMLAWAWWEHSLVIKDMARDVVVRPFVTVGVIAFVPMTLMALTSNQFAIRILRRHWKTLHRVVYLVVVAAIVHYWLHKSGKNDFFQVWIYGLVAAALLGWRLVAFIRRKASGVQA